MREPVLIVTKEEGPLGRPSSKVSQIATMFQSGEEATFSFQQPKQKEIPTNNETAPGSATVVRTQSHVARFNTAKALFENLAEKKGEGELSRTLRAGSGRVSSLSTSSNDNQVLSRSPSPGNHLHPAGSTKHSVATISSIAISPPISPAPSLVSPSSSSVLSASPIPRSTSSCRTLSASSSDSGEFPVPHKRSLDKSETQTDSDKIDARKFQFPRSASDFSKKQIAKPSKPMKPDSLTQPKTSHQQRKELVQRHKNWFQTFSKSKSPATSPVKSSLERALSPDGSDSASQSSLSGSYELKSDLRSLTPKSYRTFSPERLKNSETPTKKNESESPEKRPHSTEDKTDSLSPGRTPTSTEPTKLKTDVTNVNKFEDASTLPSSWCPPKQYVSMTTKPPYVISDTKDTKFETTGFTQITIESRSSGINTGSSERITRTDSCDEIENSSSKQNSSSESESTRNDAVVLRRSRSPQYASRQPLTESLSLRHSFHREPDNFVKEPEISRPLSSLEGDRERRLKEWERKKQEREKRHSEGNIYIPSGRTAEKTSVMERIKSFEGVDTKKTEITSAPNKSFHNIVDKPKSHFELKKDKVGSRKKHIHADLEKLRDQHSEFLIRKQEYDLQRRRSNTDISSTEIKAEIFATHGDIKKIECKKQQQQFSPTAQNPNKMSVKEETERIYNQHQEEELRRKEYSQKKLHEVKKSYHDELEIDRLEKEKMELKRRYQEQEELEKLKIEQEMEKRHKEQKELEKHLKEQEEIEIWRKEQEELESRRKEQEELERRRKEHEELERRRKEQEELERRRKEQEELERRRKEQEELERRRKEQEELERSRKDKEELERRRKEHEELERRRKEQEELERRRKEQEELERKRKEQEEFERQRKEQQELERKRKEEEDIERMRKELEGKERIRKELEEKERIRKELEEKERIRKELEEKERIRKEQEELQRRLKEQEDLERRQKEQEELERRQKEQEELERRQKEQEELERRQKEQEELERRQKEQEELKRRQKEQEELERRQKEQEELERRQKEQEELERRQKEQEELKRRQKEQEELERRQKEQEELERRQREQEELERRQREQEELEKKRTEQEKIERRRKEQEELEKRQKYQEEMDRIRKEQEEVKRMKREEEENEKERRRKEQKKIERCQREQEEIERRRREHEEIEKRRKNQEEIYKERKEQQEILRQRKEEEAERQNQRLERSQQKQDNVTCHSENKYSEQCAEKSAISSSIHSMKKSSNDGSLDEDIFDPTHQKQHLKRSCLSDLSHDIIEPENKNKNSRKLQRELEFARIKKEEEEELERRNLIQKELDRKRKEVQHRLETEEKKRMKLQMSDISQKNDYSNTAVSMLRNETKVSKNQRCDAEDMEIQKTKQRILELKQEREDILRKHVRQMQKMLDPDNERLLEDPPPYDCLESNPVTTIEDTINRAPSPVLDSGVAEKSSDDEDPDLIVYDHTVRSAQHEIEFCGPTLVSDTASTPLDSLEQPSIVDRKANTVSTCSSFEALPPPIPPHNVDPASIMETSDHSQQEQEDIKIPEVMTAEEEEKLLSHNGVILTDAEATEVHILLSESSTSPTPDKASEDDITDLSSSSKVITVEEAGINKVEELSFSSPQEEDTTESFVYRAQEVFEEDGIHYLEDGHFWFEIPGLAEEDEEYMPQNVSFHKHTKIQFSSQPIQLYSTYSVSEYDRKNDDVDPVASSAEYELEKRIEKMDVFPVEIQKAPDYGNNFYIGPNLIGDSGLGLSIIGMGVGADAGVQKLGIFIKTITPNGPTDIDGRAKVNDQIIEVDGKSLVGVTQIFAATVLKNTHGRVKFLMGRDKDPDNSEVAALIRQSLQADREKEGHRRTLERGDFDPQGGEAMFESLSSNSEDISLSDARSYDLYSNDHEEGRIIDEESSQDRGVYGALGDVEYISDEVQYLRHHLQETLLSNEKHEEEINMLRTRIGELEKEAAEQKEIYQRIQELKLEDLEEKLKSRQAEVTKYQEMLEQSRSQHLVTEKKYGKAKKIIKEYQNRERDFLHREEYHITQMEEKDAHYNALVKALKDRVIQLEADLMKAQQTAGLPVKMPSPQSSLLLASSTSPDVEKDMPRKPHTRNLLDLDLSDTENADAANSGSSKASTVERKVPPKEELDVAIPPHSLLDVSASKAKGELASRGGLARRHLPSLKKTGSLSSSCSIEKKLDESDEQEKGSQTNVSISSNHSAKHSESIQQTYSVHSHVTHQEVFQTSFSSNSSVEHRAPPPYQPPPSAHSRPLSSHEKSQSQTFSHDSRAEIPYRNPPPVARVQPVNRSDISGSLHQDGKMEHQQRLADQLKAVLAERESSAELRHSLNEGNSSKRSAASLADDVRQAVLQADIALGKKPVISAPVHLTSSGNHGDILSHRIISPQKPVQSISSAQRVTSDPGPWTPRVRETFVSSPGSEAGVVLLSQRPIDSSLPRVHKDPTSPSLTSLNDSLKDTSDYTNQTSVVSDWNKEQVAHWLMVQGLESCVQKFISFGVTGPRLINLDSRDLKNFGLTTDEKTKIKKKVKDLRLNIEKERKQIEKEKKERERLQKKAEKLAEKAEKRKK